MGKHKVRKGVKLQKSQVKSLMVPTSLPAMSGEGEGAGGVDYPWSGCGAIIGYNLFENTIRGIGFECPRCHTVTGWD